MFLLTDCRGLLKKHGMDEVELDTQLKRSVLCRYVASAGSLGAIAGGFSIIAMPFPGALAVVFSGAAEARQCAAEFLRENHGLVSEPIDIEGNDDLTDRLDEMRSRVPLP